MPNSSSFNGKFFQFLVRHIYYMLPPQFNERRTNTINSPANMTRIAIIKTIVCFVAIFLAVVCRRQLQQVLRQVC